MWPGLPHWCVQWRDQSSTVCMHANKINNQTEASWRKESKACLSQQRDDGFCVWDGLPRLNCLLVNYCSLIPLKWHSKIKQSFTITSMAIKQDQWLCLGAIWKISKWDFSPSCSTGWALHAFPACIYKYKLHGEAITALREAGCGSEGTLARRNWPLKVLFSLNGLVTSFVFPRLNHKHTSASHNNWWT